MVPKPSTTVATLAPWRRCQPRQRAKSAVLEGVDDYLDHSVYDAVVVWGKDGILEGPGSWHIDKLIDKIKTYIHKAAESAAEELSKLDAPWEKSVKKLVSNALERYAAACRYREWFLDIDLGDSFGGVAWELVRGVGPLCKQYVKDFAGDQYRSGADQDRRWDFPMYLGNLGVPHAGVS